MKNEWTKELRAEDGKRLLTFEYQRGELPHNLLLDAERERDVFFDAAEEQLFTLLRARYEENTDRQKRSHTVPLTLRFSAFLGEGELIFDCRLLRMGRELYHKSVRYRHDGKRYLP